MLTCIPWRLKQAILKWRLGASNAWAADMYSLPCVCRVCVHCAGGGDSDPGVQDAFHALVECPVTSVYIPDALLDFGLVPSLSTAQDSASRYAHLRSWWQRHLATESVHALGVFLHELLGVFCLDKGRAHNRVSVGRAL